MRTLIGVLILAYLASADAGVAFRSPSALASAPVPAVVAISTSSSPWTHLREEAFRQCEAPFREPVIVPVPALDPPTSGGRDAEGLVYQEELAIRARNLLDRDGFYFQPRPRAALNRLGMEIFVGDGTGTSFRRQTWADAAPDYASPEIRPPIDVEALPAAARVLTEIIIGHRAPAGDYPQLVNFRSSAYVRFAGFPPSIMGASMRLGARNVFALADVPGLGPVEDFPIIRQIYLDVVGPGLARALLLTENRGFCTATQMDVRVGVSTELIVESAWYPRGDYRLADDPHTGFMAFSSMLWKTEKHTPENDGDEAHDSDTLRVRDRRGRNFVQRLDAPAAGINLSEYVDAVKWSLANEDRDPAHYRDFESALGTTNYQHRASYGVEILHSSVPTSVVMYESPPVLEYADNLVALGAFRGDIPHARDPNGGARVKYRTWSY